MNRASGIRPEFKPEEVSGQYATVEAKLQVPPADKDTNGYKPKQKILQFLGNHIMFDIFIF